MSTTIIKETTVNTAKINRAVGGPKGDKGDTGINGVPVIELTQTEYNALGTPATDTLYMIIAG